MEKLIVGKSLEHQLDTVIKELAPAGNISYAVLQFDASRALSGKPDSSFSSVISNSNRFLSFKAF